jgi:hypothetical protein
MYNQDLDLMRRFHSINRGHHVVKKGRIVAAACRAVVVRSRKSESSWTTTIFAAIRHGSSMK